MTTYTAEEWEEIEKKNFEAWALKQGVDLKSGKFTFEDGMKLSKRAAAERHWVLEHANDDEIPAEMDEGEIQEYVEANPVEKVERLLKKNGMSLYEFHLFLEDLQECGFFAFDQLELEDCEDEVNFSGDGVACLVKYKEEDIKNALSK